MLIPVPGAAAINAFMCGGSYSTAGPCPICCKCDTSGKGRENDSAHLWLEPYPRMWVLLKKKILPLAKAEVDNGCASVPIHQFLCGVVLAVCLGFLFILKSVTPQSVKWAAKEYKEMLTVKEVIKRGSQQLLQYKASPKDSFLEN